MEDRRVQKTKRNFKQTLITLLAQKPFEQITVTELCNAAITSRITFYAHYSDKYELADDLFRDMLALASEDYHRLQKENNPNGDAITGYCNLLDCILNIYYSQFAFFSHTSPEENPYLYFSFYRYILEQVQLHAEKERRVLPPKYSSRRLAGFLCYGIWGFINESHQEKCPLTQIRSESRALLIRILNTELLTGPAVPRAGEASVLSTEYS